MGYFIPDVFVTLETVKSLCWILCLFGKHCESDDMLKDGNKHNSLFVYVVFGGLVLI